jgi:hypothetical protein
VITFTILPRSLLTVTKMVQLRKYVYIGDLFSKICPRGLCLLNDDNRDGKIAMAK